MLLTPMEFADLPKNGSGISRQWGPNMFDRACLANGIEHKLTILPLDEWPSRAHEPDDQGCDDQGLLLPRSRELERSPPRVRGRLHLCQTPESSAMRTPFETLSGLDERTINLQTRSVPPHPGTTHLEGRDGKVSVSAASWVNVFPENVAVARRQGVAAARHISEAERGGSALTRASIAYTSSPRRGTGWIRQQPDRGWR